MQKGILLAMGRKECRGTTQIITQ
jgi:hypothetical protein